MEFIGMECEGCDYTELAEAVWSVGGFCGNVDTMKMNFLISKIH
jgi:predicted nucleic-acid-binding Zn-ribbon protein